jgi:peptidoglycan/LPS O-acetylase OafA/YrhL
MPYSWSNTWYYFIFFVPGLVTFFFGSNLLEPLWSIGVEEIFYLFWAPLVKYMKKYLLLLLLSIIGIKLLLLGLSQLNYFPELWKYLIRIHQFDAMAIGGLGAYLVFHRGDRVTKFWIFKRGFQEVIFAGLLLFLFVGERYWDPIFNRFVVLNELKYLLFLYLIIAVALIPTCIVKVENKVFSYLGKISFGIYMYHLLVLTLLIPIFQAPFQSMNVYAATAIYYASALTLTIGVAALSHATFERYFERKKHKLLAKY